MRHNHTLHSPVRVIKTRKMEWMVHVVCMVKDEKYEQNFEGKPEEKHPLGRP